MFNRRWKTEVDAVAGAKMDEAARVLALAKQMADSAIADARREAEEIIAAARREADEIRAAARTEARGAGSDA
jgi:vacuolar-type H+-ATPase subunit H